jgi:hypothetical protein
LAELASRQYGVVSRAQLRELEFGRQAIARRLAARRLRLLYPSVYAVGHWALTPESRDLAAVFACGPDALLSHRAAARRHRLLRDARIEVTARRGVKSKPGIMVHTTRLVHPDDARLVDDIPTTSVARTLVDLVDVLHERRLAAAVNEAEVRRVFDLAAVESTLDRRPGRRGRARLLRVLAAYTEPLPYTTSEAERRFPRPVRQPPPAETAARDARGIRARLLLV